MSPPNQQRKHGDGMVTLYNGERQLDCNKSNGGHADRQVYPRVYQVGKRFLELLRRLYQYVIIVLVYVREKVSGNSSAEDFSEQDDKKDGDSVGIKEAGNNDTDPVKVPEECSEKVKSGDEVSTSADGDALKSDLERPDPGLYVPNYLPAEIKGVQTSYVPEPIDADAVEYTVVQCQEETLNHVSEEMVVAAFKVLSITGSEEYNEEIACSTEESPDTIQPLIPPKLETKKQDTDSDLVHSKVPKDRNSDVQKTDTSPKATEVDPDHSRQLVTLKENDT